MLSISIFLSAQTRNRTTDTEIFSLLLYRLSYLGICCKMHQFIQFHLHKLIYWAFKDSNLGPTGYEPGALTN